MIDFDTTSGFIYHGNSEKLFTDFFPKIKRINPKIRLLVFLTDESCYEEIYVKIFNVAWQKFRIYDLFITCDSEFQQLFNSFSIFAYNLFTNDDEKKLIKFTFDYDFVEAMDELRIFIKNRYRNLNGYPLKVVIFRFMMMCDGDEDSNGNFILKSLKFQDGEMLKILSKIANFQVNFVKSPDGVMHGYQSINNNNTFTGSLGMVEYEQADFAANSRIVAEGNTTNTLCLFPTISLKLKFSVPKKYWYEVNFLCGVYNFLDESLKVIILAMFICLPLLISLFSLLCHDFSCKSIFDLVTSSYLKYIAIMSFVGVPLPKQWPLRCLYGGILILWITLGMLMFSI